MAMRTKKLLVFALTIATALSASTICFAAMQGDVDQAVAILTRFQEIPEKSIPPAVLKGAKGLAILTITKAGFIISGRGGTGVVVARLGKSWSGPSAIGTGGAGFGLQIGAQVSEFVIVLNTPDAVKAFSKGGNISLGADVSVAAGPVGRDVAADVLPMAAVYTYSRSQGLFAGVSLEGTVLVSRDETNAQYYGRKVTPSQILSGQVKPPKGAQGLLRALSKY
jgi:lipid-binding SYLF domain-containing protein